MNNVDLYLKEERKRRRFTRGYILALAGISLFVLIALGAFYIIEYAPFFVVRAITVRGAEHIDAGRVQSAALSFGQNSFLKALLGPGNMLSWNTARSAPMRAFLPEAAAVALAKDYHAHEIQIAVTERQPLGIWCLFGSRTDTDHRQIDTNDKNGIVNGDERCYWFDETGTLFKRTPAAEGSVIPVVHDYAQEHIGIGTAILPARFIPALFSILRTLKAAELSTSEVRLDDLSSEEVHATTYAGLKIYFSLRFSADSALAALRALTGTAAASRPLEYIDLRVENRVYYK